MDFEESGSQSLLVIMVSKKYTSFNFGKDFFCCGKKIVNHTFHSGKSKVSVRSKCRALS